MPRRKNVPEGWSTKASRYRSGKVAVPRGRLYVTETQISFEPSAYSSFMFNCVEWSVSLSSVIRIEDIPAPYGPSTSMYPAVRIIQNNGHKEDSTVEDVSEFKAHVLEIIGGPPSEDPEVALEHAIEILKAPDLWRHKFLWREPNERDWPN